MGEVFKKYKENFSKFIIYFILAIIIHVITSSITTDVMLKLQLGYNVDITDILNFKMIIIILINIYLSAYLLLITKKIIKGEIIEQKDIFPEALHYFPRLLGVALMYGAITFFVFYIGIIAMYVNSALFILFVILFLLWMIFAIFLSPTSQYLVYNDEKIGGSIKSGFKLGKKYFFKILGLIGILALILIIKDSLTKTEYDIAIVITYSIVFQLFHAYFCLYISNMCKEEEEAEIS